MMFKYICMPKLVAFYLREFSVDRGGNPSLLYKFIFCLCLPFVSKTFYKARLTALAIAECTNSQDQIVRVLEKITGAKVHIIPLVNEYMLEFGSNQVLDFTYAAVDGESAIVPFNVEPNAGFIYITLNGASRSEVEKYLPLLIPFYHETTIIFIL